MVRLGVVERIEKSATLYKKKNADYGDSWRKCGEILKVLFPKGVTLKTTEQFVAFSLLVRKLDKLSRISNLAFSDNEIKVKDETLTQTAEDDGVYSFMLAEVLAKTVTGGD